MKINIDELINLYDSTHIWEKDEGSPITSITGILGEDLVLGVLEHYFKNKARVNELVVSRVTPSVGARGSKLDAWIYTEKEHYQVEIKNWSASAVGGRAIKKNDVISLLDASTRNNSTYFTNPRNSKKVWKVLERVMDNSELKDVDKKSLYNKVDIFNRKSLLAFWSPVGHNSKKELEENDLKPFFEIVDLSPFQLSINRAKLRSQDFNKVSIFSASLYLRELRTYQDHIEVEMPRVTDRLKRFHKLLPDAFSGIKIP